MKKNVLLRICLISLILFPLISLTLVSRVSAVVDEAKIIEQVQKKVEERRTQNEGLSTQDGGVQEQENRETGKQENGKTGRQENKILWQAWGGRVRLEIIGGQNYLRISTLSFRPE